MQKKTTKRAADTFDSICPSLNTLPNQMRANFLCVQSRNDIKLLNKSESNMHPIF